MNFIEACNARAELELPNFREKTFGRSPSIFDDVFFETRTSFPHFGYVLCESSNADTFFMLDNNDDAVAKHWYWYGRDGYERTSIREWCQRAKRATVVFDIGAHTGVFTLTAARANPAITAIRSFEPTARAYARLTENLIVNSLLHKARPERLAISNKATTIVFNVFDDLYQIGTGNSYKTEHTSFAVRSHESCQTTTIDAYVRDNNMVPDLIKIDVEGAEIDAIEGAGDLVKSRRATFLIEVTALSIHKICKFFDGYKINIVHEDEDQLVSYIGQDVTSFTNLIIDPI